MRNLTCGTCGQPIPHGHVARYTGVDIASIQAHHIRCRQEGGGGPNWPGKPRRRNVLARWLDKFFGLW